MPPITGSPSLFPLSHTPSSNRSPYGFPAYALARIGGQWGLPRSLIYRHEQVTLSMPVRLGLISPGAAYVTTNFYFTQKLPAAHLLVMAYQQI